jgi:hypothetical protein
MPAHLPRVGALALATGLLALTAVLVPVTGASPSAACPAISGFRQIGTLGQAPSDPLPAGVGISSMALSRYDSLVDGRQIAWAVGDRGANEISGLDRIWLFGFDARDGSLAVRFPLDPSVFQDDPNAPGTDGVTSFADSPQPVPDIEDVALEPLLGRPGRLWLFDTGDNSNKRADVNAYVVREPDLTGPQGVLDSDPSLSDAAQGPMLTPTRYPILLEKGSKQVKGNIEAGFVDPITPGGGDRAVYLVMKAPKDLDGEGTAMKDDFRVFSFSTRATPTPGDLGAMNVAQQVGFIDLNAPTLRVTAGAMLDDGTSFTVRAVSGGKHPDLDVVATWNRTPGTSVASVLSARHTPDCTVSLNSLPKKQNEESIAYGLTPGSATGWDGFVWTHDLPTEAAPLFHST